MITTTDVHTIPRIKHREAMQITAVESGKFAAALRHLRPDDWANQPTAPAGTFTASRPT